MQVLRKPTCEFLSIQESFQSLCNYSGLFKAVQNVIKNRWEKGSDDFVITTLVGIGTLKII